MIAYIAEGIDVMKGEGGRRKEIERSIVVLKVGLRVTVAMSTSLSAAKWGATEIQFLATQQDPPQSLKA